MNNGGIRFLAICLPEIDSSGFEETGDPNRVNALCLFFFTSYITQSEKNHETGTT
jgi:hypothetical protein